MSKPTRRLSSSLLAGATALSLLTGWVSPVRAAPASVKASVLTLESDDPGKAQALSKALQSEFAARGVGGGRDMSLAELKLTMGCDEPPSAACLGSGGKSLGIDRMIYGSLTRAKSGGYTLNLSVMEVGTTSITKTVNTELGADALTGAAVQSTAKDIVTQVLGPEATTAEPDTATPADGAVEEPGPQKSGKLVWGRYDAPKWKKAGLAVSAVLTVASLGLAVGTWIVARPGGKIESDVRAAGARSLMDKDASNNVSPYMEGSLCKAARGTGGTPKNQEMADLCDKGDGMATAATAGAIATGIFAASTVVFTTLLFVHKDKPGVARLQKHGLSLGAMPLRAGGVMVGGVVRF